MIVAHINSLIGNGGAPTIRQFLSSVVTKESVSRKDLLNASRNVGQMDGI